MKIKFIAFLFGNILCGLTFSQQTLIQGSVKVALSYQPIEGVSVTIEGTALQTETDSNGRFLFSTDIPLGEQVLKLHKTGYIDNRYPIVVNENTIVEINDMLLERSSSEEDKYIILLADDELNDDTKASDNISGLLSASRDVFQRTAAFNFGASFFKIRGLDSKYASVLINGISMHKMYNGKPQWSNWGGLNDVMRNQELASGLKPSRYGFGGFLGTTNIHVRASQYRAGGRVAYAMSNRSYNNRFMATYATGMLKNNWAFTLSLGKRWGNSGFQEGTPYNANAMFFALEKKVSKKHSINFTGIYSPNKRGKAAPNTQEVYNIKSIKYNSYWGWQNGEKRNARVKHVEEPILMLNHFWDISTRIKLNTNVAYQFGSMGNSRLDYNGTDLVSGFPQGGGANPDPTYYQKLPSYFERNFPNNLEFAYMALKQFQDDGQIDWDAMYTANVSNALNGGNAIYALYEDRVDDKQFSANTILNYEVNDNIICHASLNYNTLKSKNYAKVLDLLGAQTYLDIDAFATQIDEAQNDLLNPNRLVKEGDAFKYHFNIYTNVLGAYAQAQFKYNKVDFYTAGSFTTTQYQREGLYRNGGFPDNSLGKGKQLTYTGYAAKGGLTYKLSGKHYFDINLGYSVQAPTIQNTYSNVRENHNVVPNSTEEKISMADASYMFRSKLIKARVTGYYVTIQDASEIAFYFADGIGGDNAVFVQEILQGVAKKHLGLECGIEAHVNSTLKLKGVAALGQFTYNNNPNLYLTTEANAIAESAGFINGFKALGTSNLKDYKLAVGPHQAYALGFEYNDPKYWWFGATVNWFANAYLDISPLARTSNFTTDFDGNSFSDYDEVLANELLKQEQFRSYMVVNLTGGKSWKLGDYYVGLFVSVNNLLDEVYKTGGFEQARNANYRQLRDDKALSTPIFGPKYWYGRGTTYFLNANIKY